MITYTNSRTNGGEPHVVQNTRSVIGALISLIWYELGYGGKIKELTPTKIVIFTRVLAAQDTVTFEGNEKEMKILLAGVFYHSRTSPNLVQIAEKVIQITKGNALLTSHSAIMFTGGVLGGGKRLRACIMAALEIEDTEFQKFMLEVKQNRDFEEYLNYYYQAENKKEASKFLQTVELQTI